jgi:hypothetical protein
MEAAVRRVVAEHHYEDVDGSLLYVVERLEPKDFRQKRPGRKAGAWSWSLGDVKRVPYRLPALRRQIVSGNTVFVVEGEKDANRLNELRLCATTSAGGATWRWPTDFAEHFFGAKRVIVVADCDAPGRKAARDRAILLRETVDDVRLLDLAPERSDGFDVTDWLDGDHTIDDLKALVEALTPVEPLRDALPVSDRGASPTFLTIGELYATPIEPDAWLVDGVLPRGGLSLCVAKPKVGKSTLSRNLALCVARGRDFLGRHCARGAVLYVAIEDKLEELARLFRAMDVTEDDPIYTYCGRTPEPKDALEWLRESATLYQPALIVVDTFQRFARLRDINDYALTTNALDTLMHVARESGAHLLMTHHGKKSGGEDGDAVLGSTGLFGAVDTLIEMRRRGARRTLRSFQRYGTDIEETIIELDGDTYLLSETGSVAEADRHDAESSILAWLEERPEPAPRDEILEAIGGRAKVCVDALKALAANGRVIREGNGKKGDPFRFSVPIIYAGMAERNAYLGENPREIVTNSVPASSIELAAIEAEQA